MMQQQSQPIGLAQPSSQPPQGGADMLQMQLSHAMQQNPAGTQHLQQVLEQAVQSGDLNIPPDMLPKIMQLLQQAAQNPAAWPQVYQMAQQIGIDPSILPPPNASPQEIQQFVVAALVVLHMIGQRGQGGQMQPPQAGMQPPQGGMQPAAPAASNTSVQGFADGGVVGGGSTLDQLQLLNSNRGLTGTPARSADISAPALTTDTGAMQDSTLAPSGLHPLDYSIFGQTYRNGQVDTSPSISVLGQTFRNGQIVNRDNSLVSILGHNFRNGQFGDGASLTGYETGGMIGAATTPINFSNGDNQVIAVSPGEGVLNTHAVRMMGGPDAINKLNYAATGVPSGGRPVGMR